MGVPQAQGKSAPVGYSILAHKNTVLREHYPKRQLTLKTTHLLKDCSRVTLTIEITVLRNSTLEEHSS